MERYDPYKKNGRPGNGVKRPVANNRAQTPGSRYPRDGRTQTQSPERNAIRNGGRTGSPMQQNAYRAGGNKPYRTEAQRRAIAERKRRKKRVKRIKRILLLVLIVLLVLMGCLTFAKIRKGNGDTAVAAGGTDTTKTGFTLFSTPVPTPSPTPEPTPTPTPTPKFDIPHAVAETRPENWGYVSEVEVNGIAVPSYLRPEPMEFDIGEEYTDVEGIVTFRGNNYREGASYGTAAVTEKKLKVAWSVETGEIMRGTSSNYKNTWTGSLWVGQPLIVKWPESTKRVMNMYDSAKSDPDLVEVIYATASGRVYFLNLNTGKKTRDPLDLGMPFKGAGALDPRGYPILYLGSGDMYDDYPDMQTRAMAISLIDYSILYEFGKAYDPFAIRGWHAYDSSPLVNAETDTLIYPGENGIIYTIRLGTEYNEATGSLSMNPVEVAKYRYNSTRSTTVSTFSYEKGIYKYWLGFESSVVTWGHYMYLTSNDGYCHCIDLNTLETVWIQDIWDDANGTLVLEEDEANRTAWLYAGVSLHFTVDKDGLGTAPFFRINAVTGEIDWEYSVRVHTKSGSSGGVQATAVLGKGNISDLVIVPFAKVFLSDKPDSPDHGYLVALDKKTGKERWRQQTRFCWSSPVAVYTADQKGYIIQADSAGHVYLFDGATGERLYNLNTESKNFEASPAVFGNMIVIGNKDKKIFGIRIS